MAARRRPGPGWEAEPHADVASREASLADIGVAVPLSGERYDSGNRASLVIVSSTKRF